LIFIIFAVFFIFFYSSFYLFHFYFILFFQWEEELAREGGEAGSSDKGNNPSSLPLPFPSPLRPFTNSGGCCNSATNRACCRRKVPGGTAPVNKDLQASEAVCGSNLPIDITDTNKDLNPLSCSGGDGTCYTKVVDVQGKVEDVFEGGGHSGECVGGNGVEGVSEGVRSVRVFGEPSRNKPHLLDF
jgi:hypothetical protein